MKNKYLIIILSVFSLIYGSTIIISTNFFIKEYDYNYSLLLNNIIDEIHNQNPEIDKQKIIEILNKKELKESNTLKEYGIDINKESIGLSTQHVLNKLIIANSVFIIIYLLIIVIIIITYNHIINKRIRKITKYVEEINKKNYKLDIISNGENSLSLLQNEIYKTMVMLKESADNSLNDKQQLKDSLSDISHQLKTPLTSISIMLDNIIDNADMEPAIREDFILDIKREIMNINFLVQNILKLSKFDANIIDFSSEYIEVKELINETVKKVLVLSDLKNIKIDVKCDKDMKIKGDFKWEVEALSNILKNCVEHAEFGSIVKIHATDNRIYAIISIEDQGTTIDSQDINHIFERFYKGKNSTKDSIGIGLALAKTIIEKDNGAISVESKDNITEFKIKYFN